MDNTEHIKNLFNEIALKNEDKISPMMSRAQYNEYDKLRLIDLGEMIDLKGESLLLAGCGIGRDIGVWKRFGFTRIVGIDLAEGMIALCKEKFPEHEFYAADVENLEMFKSDEFDVVVCNHVLTHIADDEKAERAVRELERVAKDVLIIGGNMDYNSESQLGGKLRKMDVYERMVKNLWNVHRFRDFSVYSEKVDTNPPSPVFTHRTSYLVLNEKVVL